MKFTVLSLFPDLVDSFFQHSIMKRAVEDGRISKQFVNIRDFASDKHKNCDDTPYGGGAGMLLKPEPLAAALKSLSAPEGSGNATWRRLVIFPTPSGKPYRQTEAYDLANNYDELVFIAGRYEGIDQRIIDLYVDREYCVGDFVLSSGEIASLVIIDSVYRLCAGVISKESLHEESFTDKLLEYPQYTRPTVFEGVSVPDVLLNGNHAKIEKWRLEQRIKKTRVNRPDLLK